MHWRPDAITRTGVIEPMWIRQLSPVDMATHTIDPFIQSVRGRGPAVSPYPAPEDVAYAAGKLATQFLRGKKAVICMGTEKIKVGPNTPPGGGVVGAIIGAAQQIARNGSATIQFGARRVIVCRGADGEPVLTHAAPAAPAPAMPVSTAAASAMPTATPMPTPTTPAAKVTTVTTRETPMAVDQQKKSGFGGPPLLANEILPAQVRPGHVPQAPFLDYAFYYRKLNYDDNVWARRNFQASIAHRYAPNAIRGMNQATSVPIHDAQRQANVPLHTRPDMVMKRWPTPESVFPLQAATSVAARPEQR